MGTKKRSNSGSTRFAARRELFCQEYLKDLNVTAAMIRAGYSAHSASSNSTHIMARADVMARIAELKAQRSGEIKIEASYVLGSLKSIADRCQQEVPVLDKKGVPTGEFKFDAAGANKALELLGKHLGLFIERKAVSEAQALSLISVPPFHLSGGPEINKPPPLPARGGRDDSIRLCQHRDRQSHLLWASRPAGTTTLAASHRAKTRKPMSALPMYTTSRPSMMED